MKSLESMIRQDIEKYMAHGFSLESACFQVRGLHLKRLDHVVAKVKGEIMAEMAAK